MIMGPENKLNSEIVTKLGPIELEIWRQALAFQDKRQDLGHAATVTLWAIKLLETENADRGIVVPAAILHDIGWCQISEEERMATVRRALSKDEELRVRLKHQEKGVRMALAILQKVDYDPKFITDIVEIISQHDTRVGFISEEDSVMRDADKLWRYTREGIEVDARLRGVSVDVCLQELTAKIERYFNTKTAANIARKELKMRALEQAK